MNEGNDRGGVERTRLEMVGGRGSGVVVPCLGESENYI